MNASDVLFSKIVETQNPTTVGLDTKLDYLPEEMLCEVKTLIDAGKAITEFNRALVDAVADIVPSVKVQVAYYEMYGLPGMQAFYDTLTYAAQKGLAVIADVKRNDIGSTAGCYAQAYLGNTKVGENSVNAFPALYATVNPYLGVDGIAPFTAYSPEKGIFCLVRTSNPSGAQLQNRLLDDGKTVYEYMGSLVDEWGSPYIGEYGYSAVGAVVGATHPQEGARLRALLPRTPFLVPGYGAQGGTADGVAVCFDARGLGAVVNNSRGILTAYRKEEYRGLTPAQGARAAAIKMKSDLLEALQRRGVSKIGG